MVVGALKRQRLFSKTRSYYIFVLIMHFVSRRVTTNLQFSLHAFHKGDNQYLTPRVPVLFGKELYNLGRSHKKCSKATLTTALYADSYVVMQV